MSSVSPMEGLGCRRRARWRWRRAASCTSAPARSSSRSSSPVCYPPAHSTPHPTLKDPPTECALPPPPLVRPCFAPYSPHSPHLPLCGWANAIRVDPRGVGYRSRVIRQPALRLFLMPRAPHPSGRAWLGIWLAIPFCSGPMIPLTELHSTRVLWRALCFWGGGRASSLFRAYSPSFCCHASCNIPPPLAWPSNQDLEPPVKAFFTCIHAHELLPSALPGTPPGPFPTES